jgi:glycosyltransferase involved in cell wall biosynthesis
VITSVYNGGHEVLTHGLDGWVVRDPRDAAAMARWLLALRDEDRRVRMRDAARRTAEQHPVEEKLSAVAAILEDVAERKGRAVRP